MRLKMKCLLTCLNNTHEPILLENCKVMQFGRSAITKIRERRCSKTQIELTANYEDYKVSYKHIGSNAGGINGKIIHLGEQQDLYHKDKLEFLFGQYPHEIIFDPEPPSSNSKEVNKNSEGIKRKKNEGIEGFIVKKPRVGDAEDNWESFFNGQLLMYKRKDLKSSKIAAYDMDGTLITTISGRVFAKDIHDWRLLYPDIPKKLNQLSEEGFNVIVFTNQAGVGTGKTPVGDIKSKISKVMEKLNVPVQVLVSTGKGKYRKPMPGMWDFLLEKCADGLSIDMESSFYVGDAAGRLEIPKQRKKDHSNADRLFALNIGVPFYTPEQHFLGSKSLEFKMPEFIPSEVSTSGPLYDPVSTKVPDNPLEVILLVGLPGSGKSFFAEKHLMKLGYVSANRDSLGSWQKCVSVMEKCLKEKQHVVIDNTNVDKVSRLRYIESAKKMNVPIRCFYFDISLNHCKHNNKFREITGSEHSKVNTMIYNSMKSKYEQPDLNEGFADIVRVNFVPSFKNEKMEKLYKLFLLES